MTQPNLVLVVMDTARYGALFGSQRDETIPHISTLAAEGTTYSRAFSTAPWTLPSHASLFSGTHSSKHGAHAGHKQLDDSLRTLSEVFDDAGYETAAVSNNTWISEEFGFSRGFDTFHKTWQYVQSDTDLGEIARTKEGTAMFRALASRLTDGNPVVNVANAVYGKFLRKQNDDGAKQTNEWIADWLTERSGDDPFFLFANYLEPHLEYRPPKQYAERFLPDGVSFEAAMEVSQDAWGYIAGEVSIADHEFEILRALYHAEIAYLDERIGELRNLLVEAGEWDDTIFVVTSDHGENIGEHGMMDHQYCLYDTLTHVPLIIHGDGFETGTTNDELIQLTDLVPTLLDAAGIDDSAMRSQTQGRSFHPESETPAREHVISEYMAPQPSMDALQKRVGTLTEELRQYDRSLRAIRTKEHKLIVGSDGSREFYHVDDDPAEQQDLAETAGEQIEELEDKLEKWLESFEHAKSEGTVSMSNDAKSRLEDLGYLQ